jgi:hypothetical protein
MSIVELFPVVLTVVEILKRFIPNKYRGWAAPLVAVGSGVGISWAAGGHTAGMEALVNGLGAAAAAVGTYSGSKVVGTSLGVK